MDLWLLYSQVFDTIEDNPAKRMLNEALKQNVNTELLFYQYFKVIDNKLYYKDNLITNYPKIAFLRCHELWLVEHLENMNVRVINTGFTIKSCRDKLITHTLVDKTFVPQIKTLQLLDRSYDDICNIFGNRFILKYRSGSQGQSIYLIEAKEQFDSIVLNINKDEFLIQEYIETSYGQDIRVYIVGDNVIGAALRKNDNSFMSNLAQGGLSYDYPLTDELKKNSLAIKDILKGDIISVDYVIGKSGLLFCEANTNAGFASFNYLGYPMREIFISYIKKELSK